MSKREINKFTQKKAMLEVLERVFSEIDNIKNFATKSYEAVAQEPEQARDRDGNLKWADDEHTIPYHRPIYDWVDVPEDDLTDNAVAQVIACDEILKVLEKMI